MEDRKLNEKAFHDKLREGQHEQRWSPEAEGQLKGDPLWTNFKYYSIEGHSLEFMERGLLAYCRGASVLDYCCGNGQEALFVARNGAAHVVGIDISEVSIENCRAQAREQKLDGTVEFRVMDAEALAFPDNSFDLIMEYGVLHHLDLSKAMAELARVLKPGGHIVCVEALAHNPVIHLYRRLTPGLRTAWEVDHILGRRSFDVMRRHFDAVEQRFFHLTTLGAVPLRNTRLFPVALGALRQLDDLVLRVPGLKWLAWQTVFVLSRPRKKTAAAGKAADSNGN